MSTRSLIAIVNSSDNIRAIYCHFDGYVTGVGATLYENYQDVDKLNKLIDLGDISSLKETVETAVAYARDRHENYAELKPKTYSNALQLLSDGRTRGVDYIYAYNAHTSPRYWVVNKVGTIGWRFLSEELNKAQGEID